jgi:hypothetical protein
VGGVCIVGTVTRIRAGKTGNRGSNLGRDQDFFLPPPFRWYPNRGLPCVYSKCPRCSLPRVKRARHDAYHSPQSGVLRLRMGDAILAFASTLGRLDLYLKQSGLRDMPEAVSSGLSYRSSIFNIRKSCSFSCHVQASSHLRVPQKLLKRHSSPSTKLRAYHAPTP